MYLSPHPITANKFKKSLKVETEPEFNLNKNVEIKLLNQIT